MRQDLFENPTHLQRVTVLLIVEDVAASQRCFVEVPDERLLLERQRLKAVGVELYDGGILDLLE